jgi:DNA polymerase sigma
VLRDIEEAVHALWPDAVVQVFGSFAAGLSTFDGDLDITISRHIVATTEEIKGD